MERREGEPTQGGIMKKEELRRIPEEKEAEKLPPIALIYRDNDLFKEWIPKIAEMLKFLDRQVEIQSFPQGTDEEEIKAWIESNMGELKSKELVTDYTCQRNIPERRKYLGGGISTDEKLLEPRENLDKLLDGVSQKIILGKTESKIKCWDASPFEKGGMESAKEVYPEIVKQILKNKDNMPKKVFIVREKLRSHAPFGEVGSGQEAAETLKGWLTEGGIPEKIIETDEIDDIEGGWIIVDRHYRFSVDRGIRLELPLADFYKNAKEAGLITVKPEELEKGMKELLKEKFGKKEEKE